MSKKRTLTKILCPCKYLNYLRFDDEDVITSEIDNSQEVPDFVLFRLPIFCFLTQEREF